MLAESKVGGSLLLDITRAEGEGYN